MSRAGNGLARSGSAVLRVARLARLADTEAMTPTRALRSSPSATAQLCHRALAVLVLVGLALMVDDPASAGGPHDGRGSLSVHERAVDLNHDGIYELLRIDAEAQLDEAGSYVIRPLLCADTCLSDEEPLWGYDMEDLAAWQLERWPNVRVRHTTKNGRSDVVTTDARKRIRFSCWFDGVQLAVLKRDGPWHFCPDIQDERGMASAGQRVEDLPDCANYELSAELRPWSRGKFSPRPVLMYEVTWRFVQPDTVVLVLPLDVLRSGRRDVRVMATHGTYSADTTISRVCRVGADTLAVKFVLRDSRGSAPDTLTAAKLRMEVHPPAEGGGTARSCWTYPSPRSPWYDWCGIK